MLIQIYEFLRNHRRTEWKLIHHFVYNLTAFLAVAMPITAFIGILVSLILLFMQPPLFPLVAKITGCCIIGGILFWSTMNWIDNQ